MPMSNVHANDKHYHTDKTKDIRIQYFCPSENTAQLIKMEAENVLYILY